MASVASETQDRSPLSLSMDHLASSSPFPSPSSSFVPPPVPGTHEFAVPSPNAIRGKKLANVRKELDESRHNNATASHNKSNLENSSSSADLIESTNMTTTNGSPTTPTPTNVFTQTDRTQSQPQSEGDESTTSTLNTRPDPTTPTSLISQALRQSLTPGSRHSRDSLMSNRPAPPSPEPRRVSGALSTSSNRSLSARSSASRPSSTALSRTGSTRMSSRLSTQIIPMQMDSPTASTSTRRPRSLIVKIRDFAFQPHDERHRGLGPDVPRPNRVRVLNRHRTGGSVSSVASSEGEDEGEDDDGGEVGWSGFKWGAFPWTTGKTGGNGTGTDEYAPTSTDFARNFGVEGSGSEGADVEADVECGSGELSDDEDGEGEEADDFLLGDEPLYPGVYRALYAFESESPSEMPLEVDQEVRVVGRGGGVGWAVVVKPEEQGGGHALVPESYLEIVRLDEEAEEIL